MIDRLRITFNPVVAGEGNAGRRQILLYNALAQGKA